MSAVSLLVFAARFSDLPASAATELRRGQTRKLAAAATPDQVVSPFAFLDRSGRRGGRRLSLRLGGSYITGQRINDGAGGGSGKGGSFLQHSKDGENEKDPGEKDDRHDGPGDRHDDGRRRHDRHDNSNHDRHADHKDDHHDDHHDDSKHDRHADHKDDHHDDHTAHAHDDDHHDDSKHGRRDGSKEKDGRGDDDDREGNAKGVGDHGGRPLGQACPGCCCVPTDEKRTQHTTTKDDDEREPPARHDNEEDDENEADKDAANAISALFGNTVTRAAVEKQVDKWDHEIDEKSKNTNKLVQKMTKDELNKIVVGAGWGNKGYVGVTRPVPSLEWSGLTYQDGPQGFRTKGFPGAPSGKPSDTVIGMPACGAAAFSWDQDHATAYGLVMGKVFNFHEAHVILGPGVQLIKNPHNGRNFEYVGSEDPCLGGRMAESMVRAHTSQGALSTLKHYNYNDWEVQRHTLSVTVPMPASMELYVRPFVAGLSAGAQSVMCAYNRFKGESCCGNAELLTWLNQLSKRFFIMTDWGVVKTNETVDAKYHLEAGLHQEQPGGPRNANTRMGQQMLHAAHASTKLKQAAAARILAAAEDGKQFYSHNNKFRKSQPVYSGGGTTWKRPDSDTYQEWRSVTKQLVVEEMVLLKNDGGMLPLGPDDELDVDKNECGEHALMLSGGGSGAVPGQRRVFPKEGVHGAAEQKLLNQNKGKGKKYRLTCRSSFAGEAMVRDAYAESLRYRSKGRGLSSPAVDEQTIVFLSAPGQVPLGELTKAGAILYSLFPGQMAGHALADVLTGVYQPGGKLATSLYAKASDSDPPDPLKYDGSGYGRDGLELGYRGHLARAKERHGGESVPLFWFGFGLPYFPPKMSERGAKSDRPWEDLVTVAVKHHDYQVRGIYFCVTSEVDKDPAESKLAKHQGAVLAPSPVVQFYAKKQGRDYPELISFRKIHELQPGATACRVAFYDPVHKWDEDSKKFVDQAEWALLVSLNGPQEAKAVKNVAEPKEGEDLKQYPSLVAVYKGLRERHAAEFLLANSEDAAKRELHPVFQADLASENDVDKFWSKYLERAKRSPIKTLGLEFTPSKPTAQVKRGRPR